MGKRLILPYAIIAILGIFTVIIISYVGVDQRNTIENPEESGETEVLSAEDVFKKTCASCHGGDLEGKSAPALTSVGAEYSEEEIEDIINNGKGEGMPAGLVQPDESAKIAEWLAEME